MRGVSVLVLQKHDTNRSAAPLVAGEFLQKRKLTGPRAARTDEQRLERETGLEPATSSLEG